MTPRSPGDVHVANTKAAWYGFNNPLDNGDLAPGLPGQLRKPVLSSMMPRANTCSSSMAARTQIAGADVECARATTPPRNMPWAGASMTKCASVSVSCPPPPPPPPPLPMRRGV